MFFRKSKDKNVYKGVRLSKNEIKMIKTLIRLESSNKKVFITDSLTPKVFNIVIDDFFGNRVKKTDLKFKTKTLDILCKLGLLIKTNNFLPNQNTFYSLNSVKGREHIKYINDYNKEVLEIKQKLGGQTL